MARENYYILLNLDPDKDTTWASIDEKSKMVFSDWSKMSITHPRLKVEYDQLVAQKETINAVLKNEGQRESEAEEAKQIIAKRKAEATAKLEEMIRAMSMAFDDGSITPDQFTYLKGISSDLQLSDADVTTALGRLKVTINTPKVEKIEDTLDDATTQSIRTSIEQLNKMWADEMPPKPPISPLTLYKFLGLEERSSTQELLKKSGEDYAAVSVLPKKGDVTLRQILLGHCMNLFNQDKNPTGRAKYDASLRKLDTKEIIEFVDLVVRGRNTVPVKIMVETIRRAAKTKIPQKRIVEEIRAHARAKGYVVEVPHRDVDVIPANTTRCGHCHELINQNRPNCPKCHHPAQVTCPKCRFSNPSDARECSRCHFAVGDMFQANRLIRDAKALMVATPSQAKAKLNHALIYWPGNPEATDILRQIEWQEKNWQTYADAVQQRFAAKEYWIAQADLDALALNVSDHPRLTEWRAERDDQVTKAKAIAEKALELETEGKTDAALEQYGQAVRVCTDLPEARGGLKRCPPAPPNKAQAIAAASGVTVSWEKSPARGQIVYRVVRTVGSLPISPNDGETLGQLEGFTFIDSKATPGLVYYYTIFSEREGVPSATAAATKPVMRLANVTELQAIPGDGKVELTWKPPPNVRMIEIWRQAGNSPSRGRGTRLTSVLGNTSAIDTGLVNGNPYGYCVVAVFSDVNGEDTAASGIPIITVPTAPPYPVKDLRITREEGFFVAEWSPPPTGEVHVYRIPSVDGIMNYRVGQVLPSGTLEKLGTRVPSAGPTIVRDQATQSEVLILFPVTVIGAVAVTGQWASQAWVDDIENLSATSDGKTLRCQMAFPKGVDLVYILIRGDRSAESHDDSKAIKYPFSRAQAQQLGDFSCPLPKSVAGMETVYVSVFSALSRNKTWYFSQGKNTKLAAKGRCRALWHTKLEKTGWLCKTGNWELTVEPNKGCKLPELKLVGTPKGYPLSLKQGQVIATIPPKWAAPNQPTKIVFPPPPEGISENNLRLFHGDPEDADWLELLPNKT